MGKIRFFVGRNVDARQQLLKNRMVSAETFSFLHLIPTKGRVMELESEYHFWLRRKAETLTGIIHGTFENNIRQEKYQHHRFIDESLRLLLIKNILFNRNLMPDGLSYFSKTPALENRNNEISGICKAISGFFTRLVDNNLQDRFVQDLTGRIISLEEKVVGKGEERYALASDLIWLFGDYEEIKREIKGFDRDDIISSVKAFLELGKIPSTISESRVLIFDGFDYLTRVEEDILFKLFQLAPEVWWLLDYFETPENVRDKEAESVGIVEKERNAQSLPGSERIIYDAYQSFSCAGSLISRLKDAGVDFEFVHADIADSPDNPGEAICYPDEKCEVFFNSLKVRSFPNRVDEVRSIAREIKKIIKEDGLDLSCDLGRIRVIFPDLNEYSSLVSEIFQEYGIPFSLTKGLPLHSHPLADLFRLIFEVPLNEYQREDIFNLFSSEILYKGLTDTSESESIFEPFGKEFLFSGDDIFKVESIIKSYSRADGSDKPNIFIIDEVASKCGLSNLNYGLKNPKRDWLRKIQEFYKEKIRVYGRKQEELYREYCRFIVNMNILEQKLNLFREITNQRESEGIEEVFEKILISLGFPENLLDITKKNGTINFAAMRKIAKRDMKAFSLLMEIIKASARELSLESSLYRISDGFELLSRFYSIFKSRLKRSFLLDERNPDIIRVSQWLETRGRSFDYIFAGGLTSEEFPLREEINFIMPESPNRMFRILDPVEQSRCLFFHVLRNYRRKLYISYPLCPEEREARPSPVLSELEDMVGLSELNDTGFDSIEGIFKWDDIPYLATRDEMMNAIYIKERFDIPRSDDTFSLKQVIVRPGFPLEELLRGFSSLLLRNSSDGLYENDGLIKDASSFKGFLIEQKKMISPSQMDNLANCPMKYLFEDIYKLKRMEDLGVELSPRDMGVHIHAILKLFFKRLLEMGKNVFDLGLADAFHMAAKIVDEYLMEYPFLNSVKYFGYQIRDFLEGLETPQSYESRTERKNEGVLSRLLRFEAREFERMSPGGVETFFGYQDEPPVFLGNHKISGYIDRYDIDRDKKDTVYVYDYKTGKTTSLSLVKKGLSFQLPVYMKAMKNVFGFKKIYASFYSLKKERFINDSPITETLSENAGDQKSLDISGIRLIDDYADELFSLIDDGLFHHSVDEAICPYCDFRFACHRDVRRLNFLVDSGTFPKIYSGKKNLERWRRVDSFRKEWRSTLSSMKKAVDLKTASARQRHYDEVMVFRKFVEQNRDNLPFYADYIDEILRKIDEFKKNPPSIKYKTV